MEYNIQIAGFQSDIEDVDEVIAKIKKISKGCTIQLLDADKIGGREHILHATIHAIKAFERGENIANDLGIEICVRASAQRQISKALDILGIREGKMNICAVSVGCGDVVNKLEAIFGKKDDSVLKPNKDALKKIYKISDTEEEIAGRISKAIMEKTTLLILET